MKIYVSTGNSRMDKRWNGAEMEYSDFLERISHTKYTAETSAQYRKLPKSKQDDIKDVGGFVLGKLKGGRRKKDCVISRSAITLDMDYGTEGIIDEIEMFHDMKMAVYSTHKSRRDSQGCGSSSFLRGKSLPMNTVQSAV